MQTFYCKFLHKEKGLRMFTSKKVLEQPILNPKDMPWTLNKQNSNTKIEIYIFKIKQKKTQKND
jgi:hypothetical protein